MLPEVYISILSAESLLGTASWRLPPRTPNVYLRKVRNQTSWLCNGNVTACADPETPYGNLTPGGSDYVYESNKGGREEPEVTHRHPFFLRQKPVTPPAHSLASWSLLAKIPKTRERWRSPRAIISRCATHHRWTRRSSRRSIHPSSRQPIRHGLPQLPSSPPLESQLPL